MELTERVGNLEVGMGEVKQRVTNLEGWQRTQNGTLIRLDEKIDKINTFLLVTASSAVLSLVGTVVLLLTK
jgi:hypothetical protein